MLEGVGADNEEDDDDDTIGSISSLPPLPKGAYGPNASSDGPFGASNGVLDGLRDPVWSSDTTATCPPCPDPTAPGRDSADPREIGRVRCAFPGCEKRWDRFRYGDIKNWYRKHYCCSCQLFYCHRHTRVSSHSPRVTCDIGSNCYCEMCYDSLNPQAALKLEKSNHFDKKFMRNVKASLLSRSSNASSPGASGSS